MIGWEEAQARILALGTPVESEPWALTPGRFAAEPLFARRNQPAQSVSSMDGYAIRFEDIPGPWKIVGESAAGSPFPERLWAGESVRISTGALMPPQSDTVIIQEDVTRQGDLLFRSGEGPGHVGGNVRERGSDFKVGQALIEAGEPLTAAKIGLLVAGGHGSISVSRPIRIAIVSTGNELVSAGNACDDHELPDSNSAIIASLVKSLPVEISIFGPVQDNAVELHAVFDAAHDFDILVTSGGASVGDHDLVRPVLLDMGAMLDFWKVAMRPGKPLMAGTLGKTIVLGLPGNPVSAFATATLFLLPLVRHLSRARDPLPRRIPARCGAAMPAVGVRTDFIRARWQDGALAPLPSTDSGVLTSLAQADAFIIRPAGAEAIPAGALVEAILIA